MKITEKDKDKKKGKNKVNKKDKDFTDEETLTSWINEKFIKTFGKIHLLFLVSKGHNHRYEILKFLKDNFSINASAPKEFVITEKGTKLLEIARKKILDISQNMLKNEH
ncbi:hypothetical protein MSIBF_A1380006 [groundwater metagenome]|uniref:Uncharacterized protein n=1 Tax=groundwater metagenome TaxID=717931 RepID=A0A098E8J4_9ZZZZ